MANTTQTTKATVTQSGNFAESEVGGDPLPPFPTPTTGKQSQK